MRDKSADGPAAAGTMPFVGGMGTKAAMTQTIIEELVKSRRRVKAYGEVFTPRYMVDRMLDLVREELETGRRLRRQDLS